MKEQKGKKVVKPYDRQSPPAPNRPLTPPTRDSDIPSPRVALTNGTRPASVDWTQYDAGLNSAIFALDEELKTRKIPGLPSTNAYAFIPLGTPRSLRHIEVRGFANGSDLGGNNTCFTGYKELREFLTSTFRNDQISYLDKINSAFDEYCAIVRHEDNSVDGQDKNMTDGKPNSKEPSKKDGLSWSSSKFVDYLCFLFNYFILRAAFGHDTGSTEVFDLKGGRSRDRVIEYLLSICTGVIFRKKSVSSHCQTVRNLVGGTEDTDSRRLTPEYQSLAIDKGFTHDFPGAENPMMEDLEWMSRFYRVRKTAKGEDSEGRCPLILPPVIAAILDPATSASDIDLKRLRRSFDFSTWRLPEGLQRWWQKEQDEKAALKLAKEEEKRLREAAKLDGATTSSTATGPQTKSRKNAQPDSSLDGSYPNTTVITPEYTSSQSCRDADDSDSIMQGVQLDEQSVRCYPRYYVAQCGPDPVFQEWRAKEEAARRHWEMMTRGDKFLRECSKSDTYTPPTNFHASSRPESNDYCNAESSANATAGPGPSTLENRARFFKGSKCWA
ncbi:hypothetical protein QFC20_006174 [Naganishia adeliensis]|uniref:Uncharacterized protein n=1 Tax=Naganishia adeliensis TaxID=92952 RepID=A0ACC2VG17_9TREE|nr:hypothetical protein QFC20_006174 [Naganishia adeliensis]